MAEKKTTRFLSSILIAAAVLVAFSLIFYSPDKTITGNFALDSYIGTGYAPPAEVFENYSLFAISQDSFDASKNEIITLNLNAGYPAGTVDSYVFKIGYFWSSQLTKWIPFEFSESTVGNSYWISGPASNILNGPALSINASKYLANGKNYIVAYACRKINGAWKCGCESKEDKTCNKWMLLYFNVVGLNYLYSGSDEPAGGGSLPGIAKSCVIDIDCNRAQGEVCSSHKCIFIPCKDDSQCSGLKPKCNTATGECIGCILDLDCGPGNICSNSACIYGERIDSCKILDEAGKTYVLTADINDNPQIIAPFNMKPCFRILADNIVLDGGGRTVVYRVSSTIRPAIDAANRVNVTIKNMKIDAVEKTGATSSTTRTIHFQNMSYSKIENVEITRGQSSLYLGMSVNNVFSDLLFSDCDTPIFSASSTIESLSISNTLFRNIKIRNCRSASSIFLKGISLNGVADASGNTFTNITACDIGVPGKKILPC